MGNDLIKDITASKKKGSIRWAYMRTLNGAVYDTDGVRQSAITAAGLGYVTAPAVTFTLGNGDTTGAGATAHTVINELGAVTAIVIDNPGSGYTVTPTIELTAPPQGGTQATGTVSLEDVWHVGALRKSSELKHSEPRKTEPLEDGTPDYPESGDVTSELLLTLGQDDENTIKFIMRESKKYEFSLFYEKGKSTGTTMQQIYIPQSLLDTDYSSKSGERRPVAKFNIVKNLAAVTPGSVPDFAVGDAEDYTVPAEMYFESKDL